MPRPRTAPRDGGTSLLGMQIEEDDNVEEVEVEEKVEAQNTRGTTNQNKKMITEDDLWKEWKAKFRQHSQVVARDRDAYVEKPKKAPLRTSPVAKATSPRPRPSLQRYALRKSKKSHQKASSTAHGGQSGTTRRLWPFVTLRGDSDSADKKQSGGGVTLSFKAARKKKKKLRRVSRGGTKSRSRADGLVVERTNAPHKQVRAVSGSSRSSSDSTTKRWASTPSPFASSKIAGRHRQSSSKTGIRALLQRRRAAAQKKQQQQQQQQQHIQLGGSGHRGASDSSTLDAATGLESSGMDETLTGQTSTRAADIDEAAQRARTAVNGQSHNEKTTSAEGNASAKGNDDDDGAFGDNSGTSNVRNKSSLSPAQKRAAQLRRQIGVEYVRRHRARAKTFGRKGRKARGKRKDPTKQKGRSPPEGGGSEKTVPQIYEDIMVFLT